jgi:hypothetical protein
MTAELRRAVWRGVDGRSILVPEHQVPRQRSEAEAPPQPVWGEIFSEQKATAQPDAHVRCQVQLITDYLFTIQAQ